MIGNPSDLTELFGSPITLDDKGGALLSAQQLDAALRQIARTKGRIAELETTEKDFVKSADCRARELMAAVGQPAPIQADPKTAAEETTAKTKPTGLKGLQRAQAAIARMLGNDPRS